MNKSAFTLFSFVLGKRQRLQMRRRAGDGMRHNISIRRRVDDHIINPALGVKTGGRKMQLFFHRRKKGPTTSGASLPLGRSTLYFSLSISFDFICSIEIFTLSSESVSLPYLFLNLWAVVQTLADLYLNVSSTLSGSHYSRAGGSALSISFPNFFSLHSRRSSAISKL